ncbi:MAG: hypothetical protein ABIQ11_00660 [Saprospiraceae bacterium]
MNHNRKSWILCLAASFILTSILSCGNDDDSEPTPTEDERIYLKNETVLNKPIRDWILEWQKSFLSQNCEDASTLSAGTIPGQNQLLVALNGTILGTGSANITVQQNQSILVPVAVITYPTPTCPHYVYQIQPGQSAETFLTDAVVNIANGLQDLFVRLDGVEIEDVEKYRYKTDLFKLTPHPGLQQCYLLCHPEGELQLMTEGYFLVLKPLSPGVHTLHLNAKDVVFGIDFISTFNITVI